jgi:hypothetical protein
VRPTQSKLTVYKTKPFDRFARKARISDADLWNAAHLANQGMVDAALGGGVIKQRIARKGEGKSGGSRCIILLRREDRAIYVYGFEKKDQANIDRKELDGFRELADSMLGYNTAVLQREIQIGTLTRVEQPEEENAWKISQ